uniref:(northern house mosquito) hypothetical protein n=1 Tax=Culex pipiens TaxID=7175 RepID=A0A8D8F265_CULPI
MWRGDYIGADDLDWGGGGQVGGADDLVFALRDDRVGVGDFEDDFLLGAVVGHRGGHVVAFADHFGFAEQVLLGVFARLGTLNLVHNLRVVVLILVHLGLVSLVLFLGLLVAVVVVFDNFRCSVPWPDVLSQEGQIGVPPNRWYVLATLFLCPPNLPVLLAKLGSHGLDLLQDVVGGRAGPVIFQQVDDRVQRHLAFALVVVLGMSHVVQNRMFLVQLQQYFRRAPLPVDRTHLGTSGGSVARRLTVVRFYRQLQQRTRFHENSLAHDSRISLEVACLQTKWRMQFLYAASLHPPIST